LFNCVIFLDFEIGLKYEKMFFRKTVFSQEFGTFPKLKGWLRDWSSKKSFFISRLLSEAIVSRNLEKDDSRKNLYP